MFDCYRMILPDGTFLGNASDLPDDVVNVAETMEESVHSLNITRVRSITCSALARRCEGDRFDARPKLRHS